MKYASLKKIILIFYILIILIFYLYSIHCEKDVTRIEEDKSPGAVRGMVLDSLWKYPVPGANVQLDFGPLTAVTNDSGYYEFNDIERGNHSLSVITLSYPAETLQVNIRGHDTTTADFSLSHGDPRPYMDTTRSYFYYVSNQKRFLVLITDMIFVRFDSTLTTEEREQIIEEYNLDWYLKIPIFSEYIIHIPQYRRVEEFFTYYGQNVHVGLGNQDYVKWASPVFWLDGIIGGDLETINDEFIVSIDFSLITWEQVLEINRSHSVEFVKDLGYDTYLFCVTKSSDLNALDMANLYYEADFTIFSEPNSIVIERWP